MVEHETLVKEYYEDQKALTTSERLQKAGRRRAEQIKRWRESAKNDTGSRKKRIPKIRFSSNIILLDAAARNDVDEVRKLLLSGVDPNQGDDDGLTALHQSCIDDFEDVVRLLIEHGADVNAKDTESWTPLHAAATCGHKNICKILIDSGANILAVNADQSISFDICEENSECIYYLQNEMRKRNITQKDIENARRAEEMKILADVVKNAEMSGDVNVLDSDGATLLHLAAANGYVDLARRLLGEAISINAQDHDGWTPLHAAACWMQPEVSVVLLDFQFLIISLLSRVPDIDPFIETRFKERAVQIAHDKDCKALLEDLEREKSKLNSLKLNTQNRPSMASRESIRKPKPTSDSSSKEQRPSLKNVTVNHHENESGNKESKDCCVIC
ncbi:unnamed protein product [Oikopleura dioica]|uniref:Uncharacterized protein n=1 Tax=Oikopleura dioica TaxID=34765 RepID=E4YR02_OIKDI|nr:unnamed protein product [Oikopleura dioica]